MKIAFLSSHPFGAEFTEVLRDLGHDAKVATTPSELTGLDALILGEDYLDIGEELSKHALDVNLPLLAFVERCELSPEQAKALAAAHIGDLVTPSTKAEELIARLGLMVSRRGILVGHDCDLASHLQLQTSIAELSSLLMRGDALDDLAIAVRIGDSLGASRCFVSWHEKSEGLNDLFWHNGEVGVPRFHPATDRENFPWWQKEVSRGRIFGFSNIDELDAEAKAEAQCLSRAKCGALLAAPILDSEGRILGTLVIERPDAGEWLNTEREALSLIAAMLSTAWQQRASKASLKLQAKLIDETKDGIFLLDTRGTIKSWNRGAALIFGHEAPKAIGQHFAMLFPEKMRSNLFNTVISPILKGGHYEHESLAIAKDGRVFNVLLSLTLMRDDAGNASGVICYAMDVSARKRAEEHLRASQARLAGIINSTRDAILSFDRHGIIHWASTSACQLFELSEEAINERAADTLIADGNWRKVQSAIRKFMESHRGDELEEIIEVSALKASGKRFPAEITLVASEDELFFTANIRDLSKTRSAEERLAQSKRMNTLGTLASGVAHQLTELLGPMAAYTALLHDASLSDRQRDNVARVSGCIAKASDLVNQILTFAQRSVKEESMSVRKFLTGASQLIGGSLPRPPKLEIAEFGKLLLEAASQNDRQALILRLASLLQSSTPDRVDSQLTISAKPEAGQAPRFVEIELSIAPLTDDPMQDALFNLTLEEEDPRLIKLRDEAASIGLLLEALLEDELRLRLLVPVFSPEQTPIESRRRFTQVLTKVHLPNTGTTRETTSGQVRILIVDDDDLVQESMCDMAEALGYQVKGFTSATKALEYIAEKPKDISLIVSDLSMPEMRGDKLVEEVGLIDADLPVVISTGVRDFVKEELTRLPNMRECVQKPLTFEGYEALLLRHAGPPALKKQR